MARTLIAALLSMSVASSALGQSTNDNGRYPKKPPTKTLIIMGALIGTGAALMVAGHKQYPDRPDNNPLTWSGAGLAGGTAIGFGLHYAIKHFPSQRGILLPQPATPRLLQLSRVNPLPDLHPDKHD